jgi:hypothetical protein
VNCTGNSRRRNKANSSIVDGGLNRELRRRRYKQTQSGEPTVQNKPNFRTGAIMRNKPNSHSYGTRRGLAAAVVQTNPIWHRWAGKTIPKATGLEAATRRATGVRLRRSCRSAGCGLGSDLPAPGRAGRSCKTKPIFGARYPSFQYSNSMPSRQTKPISGGGVGAIPIIPVFHHSTIPVAVPPCGGHASGS